MPRHDYDLPPEWPGMAPDERNEWFIQERCRRQAMNQTTAWKYRVEEQIRRAERRQHYSKTAFLGKRDNT